MQSPDNMHYASASRGALLRLSSGDLAAQAAFYNSATGRGTQDAIFLSGVEANDQCAWAWIVTGAFAGHAFELPALGRLRFVNNVAHPVSCNKNPFFFFDCSNRNCQKNN